MPLISIDEVTHSLHFTLQILYFILITLLAYCKCLPVPFNMQYGPEFICPSLFSQHLCSIDPEFWIVATNNVFVSPQFLLMNCKLRGKNLFFSNPRDH